MSASPRVSALAGWLALLLLLASLLGPRVAVAAAPASTPNTASDSPESRPVIIPGREGEILALFEPHGLGDALTPGWTLHSFSIEVGTIIVWLAGPDEIYAKLTLDHLDHAPPESRSIVGFALKVTQQPPGSEAALDQLIATIEHNDDGRFWGTNVVLAGEPREHPYSWSRDRVTSMLLAWARDGLVFIALLALTLLVLVAHKLRGSPAWMKWALLGIVVLGASSRLALSPQIALAPWPYTRVLISAGRIFFGPGLAALHPEPVWMTTTILNSTLAFALLAPLAIYVHARYLLDDHRAALLAAAVVAILPLHLRFSHSDAAFIPSITVSSTAFVLIHAATRERSRIGGWIAVLLVGFPVALMYEVRPLNIMYFPLLIATAFVNQGIHTDKPKANRARVACAFVIVGAVTFGIAVPRLLSGFGSQVSEGLSLRTLSSAAMVLLSPRHNALLNPVFTPPGLTLLAVIGGVELWRRGRRSLVMFLVLWLLGFLVAHGYIVPVSPYMQARYHLHLIVPYMLLVACGADASWRWLVANRDRRAWLAGPRYALVCGAALAYVLASPLIHLHGIRNVAFNDTHEWLFVHSLREQIPKGCTIIEYTGESVDKRFVRVGTWIENGVQRERWGVIGIPARQPGEPELPDNVRALLEEPPECLYWYEGLPCFGNKPIEEREAPACQAIQGFVDLEEVAMTRFASEPYDENLAGGLGDIEHIELRLYRAHRKR